MYRVELKEKHSMLGFQHARVPNVPCGVESYFQGVGVVLTALFLMYRVELKGKHYCSTLVKGA